MSAEPANDYNAEPLHFDCVVCHAKHANHDGPGQETLVVLLMMIKEGCTAEDLYEDLCFYHRRFVDDLVQQETDT